MSGFYPPVGLCAGGSISITWPVLPLGLLLSVGLGCCPAAGSCSGPAEALPRLPAGTDMAVFCLLCGKRFQAQSALQQHMEVHAGVRSYICSECNRTFPSHTALKRHLRSHTGRLAMRGRLGSLGTAVRTVHLQTHRWGSPQPFSAQGSGVQGPPRCRPVWTALTRHTLGTFSSQYFCGQQRLLSSEM